MTQTEAVADSPPITLRAAIDEARDCWHAGRLAEAGRAYEQVASLDPDGDKAAEIARFRTEIGDLSGARAVLLTAIQARGNCVVELLMLAEVECALGDIDSARARFRSWLPKLSLDPAALKALLRLPAEVKDPDPLPLLTDAIAAAEVFPQVLGIRIFHVLRQAGQAAMAEDVLCKTAPEADGVEITALGMALPMHSARIQLALAKGDRITATNLMAGMVPPPEILARFGDRSLAWRKRAAEANRLPVPRIIHQVWIGHRPVPVTTEAWQAYCARQGYEYRLWREADLERIGVTAMPSFQSFYSQRKYQGAVDIARYVILEQVGGIYLDCDFLPCTDAYSLHDILPMVGYAALSERTYRDVALMKVFVTNAFLATPPAHPVFRTAIDGLDAALALLPYSTAWWVPGPVYLTAVSRGMLTVIDPMIVASGSHAKTLEEATAAAREADLKGAALLAWKPW